VLVLLQLSVCLFGLRGGVVEGQAAGGAGSRMQPAPMKGLAVWRLCWPLSVAVASGGGGGAAAAAAAPGTVT
jgi:hypothetical protein